MKYFIVVFILILIGAIRKQSKLVFWALYFVLFFVAVNFSEGRDLRVYENGYEQPFINVEDDVMYRSTLWGFFMIFSNYIGLSFFYFRVLCFLIWSIPIFYFIKKHTKYPTWVAATALLFPLLQFSSQMRNGVAMAFVYLGLSILLSLNNSKGKWLFIAILAFAGLLHNGVYFYCLGILALFPKIKTKTLLFVVLLFVSTSVFLIESGLFSNVITVLFGDYYAARYFSDFEGLFYWKNIPLIIGIFINLWFTYRAANLSRRFSCIESTSTMDFSLFVLRFNIIMLAAIPLMSFSNHFFRIFQNAYILSIISIANASFVCRGDYSLQGNILRKEYFMFYLLLVTGFFTMMDGGYVDFWSSISF